MRHEIRLLRASQCWRVWLCVRSLLEPSQPAAWSPPCPAEGQAPHRESRRWVEQGADSWRVPSEAPPRGLSSDFSSPEGAAAVGSCLITSLTVHPPSAVLADPPAPSPGVSLGISGGLTDPPLLPLLRFAAPGQKWGELLPAPTSQSQTASR